MKHCDRCGEHDRLRPFVDEEGVVILLCTACYQAEVWGVRVAATDKDDDE